MNSEKIKERMKELGLRQSDIAKALGIKQSTANQKINGVRPTTLPEAEIMAKTLNISDEEFCGYFFSRNDPEAIQQRFVLQLTRAMRRRGRRAKALFAEEAGA